MRNKYECPIAEISLFAEDIITTSDGNGVIVGGDDMDTGIIINTGNN